MLLCYVLLEGISAAFSGMNTLVGLYCILYLDTNYKVYMTTMDSGSISPTTMSCLIIHFSIFSPNFVVYMLSMSYLWCDRWPGNTGTVIQTAMVALANWFDMIFIHQWISFETTLHTLWIPLDGTTLLDPVPWRVGFHDASMCPHTIFSLIGCVNCLYYMDMGRDCKILF
jgi:hypothetical protein